MSSASASLGPLLTFCHNVAPEFHLVVQEGSNGEIYNMAIRGGNLGGSDGIDISGVNHWVHDVEVTNRDECVTVKSPAQNFLIERIWCNQSGGSAIGSLSDGTAISNIVYRNVYTNGGNQMLMIKSNLGSGYVKNVLFQNFLGRGTAYGLDVNQYWESTPGTGAGVQLTNITFDVSPLRRGVLQCLTRFRRDGTAQSSMASNALRSNSFVQTVHLARK